MKGKDRGSDGAGAEAECKGRESECVGAEAECKGRESEGAGAEAECKGAGAEANGKGMDMCMGNADAEPESKGNGISRRAEFANGLKDGAPIALGYLSVSFTIGIMASHAGLTVFQGALMSLLNVTSAGQFAGIQVIAAGGTLLELALTQFIINLRYALMSLSLSQKLPEDIGIWQRMVIAFANTDEIFAVAMAHNKTLTFAYMLGLQSLPILGWTGGTILGAAAGQILPAAVSNAMNVALYGMFIAIVVPAARKMRPVLLVVLLAAALRCVIYYVPLFAGISSGMATILCTVAAALAGALLFPVAEDENDE